jgi:hypothetical protein
MNKDERPTGIRGKPIYPKMKGPPPEHKASVLAYASCGKTVSSISATMGMNEESLRKYFPDELSRGFEISSGEVEESLYEMAISRKCPVATFFYLKTRKGYRESDKKGSIEPGNIPHAKNDDDKPLVIPSDPHEAAAVYLKFMVNNEH